MAIRERSAGVVIFFGQPREYLLLHYPSGHWDFAKGHLEKGETDLDTALREVKEETGLSNVRIRDSFKHAFEYYYKRDGVTVHKTVNYFVGEAPTQRIQLSHEHRGFVWLPYEKALERITYENAKDLLRHAEAFVSGPARRPPAKRPST